MKASSYTQAGFTLVELIVVIILVGILSAYAASRYIGVSSFSSQAAQEQAISVIRQIQLARMYSNVADPTDSSQNNYRLRISDSCIGSISSCALSDAATETVSNRLLVEDSLSVSTSPATSTITFDLLGNPDSGAVTITISSSSESSTVCINEQGYVNDCS